MGTRGNECSQAGTIVLLSMGTQGAEPQYSLCPSYPVAFSPRITVLVADLLAGM